MDYKWAKHSGYYSLDGLKDVVMAFSTREFYPAFKEDLDYMIEERQKFLSRLNLNIENLVCPQQIHSVESFKVEASDRGKGAFSFDETLQDTDILFTNAPEVVLSVFCADCLALFVFDPQEKAIALSHIGWRGLAKGSVEVTLKRMQELFNSEPKELTIGFSPAIRSCCYEVNSPVTNYFKKSLKKRDGKNYLDIPEIAKSLLIDLGVEERNIYDCGICPACRDEEFFSFRKQKESADRIMSIITLQ